ncbi:MAG: DUF1573 domain-containing protein [Bacteroidetes bacterium]|nr:DUF1573 domain-containing protein [Fibrella sp.]
MKNWIYLGVIVLSAAGFLACDNRKAGEEAKATVNEKAPRISLAEKGVFNFGTITEGDTVEHVFKFTNTGEFPLIINNVTASCGCTTPEWPREPIAPGVASSVRVRFNSRNKGGVQNKTVSIYANTNPSVTDLAFTVLVNPKSDSSKTTSL